MVGIATGVFKKISLKKQIALGTKAAAGAGGTARYMRRTKSTLDLAKATYSSAEILESQQRRDMRHGVRSVAGTISGELSVGGYQLPIESVLRQGAQAQITSGAVSTVAAAVTTGNFGTFTRGAGSWLTDGFKVGDVVNFSGWTTTGVNNNAHNFVIITLTALVMTVLAVDGTPVVAKAAGDAVTLVTVGKKAWVPSTAQTRDYYTINHWFADIGISEEYNDCVFTGFTATLPPSGMSTIDFPVMGLDMQANTVEYFTTPAASPNGGILASVNGVLLINGAAAGVVTGLTVIVNGNYTSPNGVVGQNTNPDIFPGMVDVTGNMTVLFKDGVMRDLFLNETESSLVCVLTANNTPGAPFTSFVMSRIKFSGATKDDGTAGLTLTMPYTALENVSTSGAGQPNLQTTISIQDSAFV
jgi:hypothetical protein